MPTLYDVIRRPLITEKGLAAKETEGTLVFDVAPDASKTEVKQAVEALFKVKLPQALAGPIDYTSTDAKSNPAPGVAITPPVGIQWQKGTKYPLEAKVVDNSLQPNAKITGDLLPTFS